MKKTINSNLKDFLNVFFFNTCTEILFFQAFQAGWTLLFFDQRESREKSEGVTKKPERDYVGKKKYIKRNIYLLSFTN